MKQIPSLSLLTLLAFSLLPGCNILSRFDEFKDTPLQNALEHYSSAKTASERVSDDHARVKLDQARSTVEDMALAAARELRDQGEWFQARQLLDKALEQVPESQPLLQARAEIEAERSARLRYSDCRLGASRARYLSDKARLLEAREALESKDFLQDWLTRRERQELTGLAPQLRDCAIQALNEQRLDLAEDSIAAAAAVGGEEFIAAERQLLVELKNPKTTTQRQQVKPAIKPSADETAQTKARRARVALQSAMTRGNLRQAKAHLTELRGIEGDTQDLMELEQAIDQAIAASIVEAHERANALYRERQIVQARDLWQRILELDPDDAQARTNLERAERVLKKLEELQGITSPEIQPAEPTPPGPARTN